MDLKRSSIDGISTRRRRSAHPTISNTVATFRRAERDSSGLSRRFPADTKWDHGIIMAEGDFVMVHSRYSNTYELNSSHVAMLSQPERVLEVVRAAAKAVQETLTAA
jgi:hypothetical protein